MVLQIFGVFIMALGLLCGGVLTLAPLGLAPLQAGPVLWALFPLLCITGFVLLAMVGKEAKVHAVTFIVSCLLLLLALAAITGIVFAAISIVTLQGDTLTLWYVLVVAGLMGIAGTASGRPKCANPRAFQ